MVEYKLFRQEVVDTNKISYCSYGISIFENNIETERICDISQNEESVRKLVEKFNMYELSPLHLSVMIEDFLYNLEA